MKVNEKVKKDILMMRKQGYLQKEIADGINAKYGTEFHQRDISRLLCTSGMRAVPTYSRARNKKLEQLRMDFKIQEEGDRAKVIAIPQSEESKKDFVVTLEDRQVLGILRTAKIIERVLDSGLGHEDKVEIARNLATQFSKGA